MPQLDKFSFFTQIFWLLLVFFIGYWVFVNYILPQLALILKVRHKEVQRYKQAIDAAIGEKQTLAKNKKNLNSSFFKTQEDFASSAQSIAQSFEKNTQAFLVDPSKLSIFQQVSSMFTSFLVRALVLKKLD